MIYKFREGVRLKIEAQMLGEHLEGLAALHDNQFSRANVVEDAKREDSRIHNEFNWDVQSAAEAHWLERAGEIIRSIEHIKIDEQGIEHRAPAFVSISTTKSSYMHVTKAMSDPEIAENVREQCRAELAGLHRRFAALEEIAKDKQLGPAMKAIGKAIEPPQKKVPQNGKNKAKDQERCAGKRKRPDKPNLEDGRATA